MADKSVQHQFMLLSKNCAHIRPNNQQAYFDLLKQYAKEIISNRDRNLRRVYFSKCCLSVLVRPDNKLDHKGEILPIKEFKKQFQDQDFDQFREFYFHNDIGIQDIVILGWNLKCLDNEILQLGGLISQRDRSPRSLNTSIELLEESDSNKENNNDSPPPKPVKEIYSTDYKLINKKPHYLEPTKSSQAKNVTSKKLFAPLVSNGIEHMTN